MWREVEAASVVLVLFLPFLAPAIMVFYMQSGDLAPLLWPSMWTDIGAFVETDECYCPWLLSEDNRDIPNYSCEDYVPAGDDEAGGDNEAGGDDVNTRSDCYQRWNAGAYALLLSVALGCLLCLIGTCCCALRWARRVTANPSKPSGVRC